MGNTLTLYRYVKISGSVLLVNNLIYNSLILEMILAHLTCQVVNPRIMILAHVSF